MASAFDDAVLLWNPGVDGGRSSDLVTDTESDSALTEGTWTNDEGFPGRVYTGATGSRFAASQASMAPLTIMFLLKRNATGNQWGGLATSSQNLRYAQAGVESNQWHVAARNGNAGNWPNSFSTTSLDLDLHVLVCRYSGALHIELWLDGVLEASENNNIGPSAGTLDRFTVGRLDRSTPVNSTNLSVYAAAYWDRELTDDEIGEISNNPRDYFTPAEPSSLTATTISLSRIDLAWTDNSDDETGFRVERSPNGVDTWTDLGDVAASTVAYSDTGLAAATTYYYRVIAFNDVGDSDPSNVASATTFADFGGDDPPYDYWVFYRTEANHLALVPAHKALARKVSYSTGEGHEEVSERFRANRAVTQPQLQEAVAVAWAAESGSAAATLQTAIHANLTARGVLRYDGASLL